MATFGSVWKLLRLFAPAVPPLLARTMVQDAYARLVDSRAWAGMLTQSQISLRAARSVTVGVTEGQTAVTSAALFVAGDDGRQFRVGGSGIPYTVTFNTTSSITLDRAYAGTTDPAATATILDAYVTMPADFGAFRWVVDPYNQRQIVHWLASEQLLRLDPNRTSSGDIVRSLFGATLSAAGRVRYETWPYPTSARVYPFVYKRRADALSDDTEIPGVLGVRTDVIRDAALVAAHRWPGTRDQPNLLFNLQAAEAMERKVFGDPGRRQPGTLLQLEIRDDDIYPQDWVTWERWPAWGVGEPDSLLRSTDADVTAYY